MPKKTNNGDRILTERRLTRLETSQTEIKDDIKEIKDNHLHTITNKISNIEIILQSNKNWLIGLLVSIILTFVALLCNFIFK